MIGTTTDTVGRGSGRPGAITIVTMTDRTDVRPVPGRVPRTGERRPPPQVVPTEDSSQPVRLPPAGATEESDAVPSVRDDGQRPAPVRRRGGSRPQTTLPEE